MKKNFLHLILGTIIVVVVFTGVVFRKPFSAEAQSYRPAAPSNLTASAVCYAQINLSWQDNSTDEDRFYLLRSLDPTNFSVINFTLPANTTSFQDINLSPNTTYYYKVSASNSYGSSPYSNVASVTTPQSNSLPTGTMTDVVTDGSYIFATSNEYGLVVGDVQSKVCPRAIAHLNVGFTPTHLDRGGDLIVVVGGGTSGAVVDVSNPSVPVKKSNINVPNANEVAVSGRYAYLSDARAGTPGYIRVVDLANPNSPVEVSAFPVGKLPREIAVVGSYAYVTSTTGFHVIDVSVPTALRQVSLSAFMCMRVTAKPGNYVYIDGAPTQGIQVVDVSNPAAPVVVGVKGTNSILNRFVVQGDYVYASWQDAYGLPIAGLRTFDVSVPTDPTYLANAQTPGTAEGIAVMGEYAYIADGVGGLQVLDVSDPYHPAIVGALSDSTPTLTKSADKSQVQSGEIITYTNTYTNGSGNITASRLEDPIPSGTSYVSGSAKLNGISKTDAQDTDEFYFDGTKGIWTLGNLAAAASGTVSFQVEVD